MGDIFIKRVKFFPSTIKSCAEKKFVLLLVSSIAFIAGVVVGLFIDKNSSLFGYCTYNAENYYCLIMFKENNAATTFFIHALSGFGYFAIFFVFGTTIFLFPLSVAVTAYRGYIFGGALVAFASIYGAQGVIIFLFTLFPQNIILTLALIFVSPCAELFKCSGKKKFFINHSINTLILFVVSILGGLVELLLLVLLLRPMNFLF